MKSEHRTHMSLSEDQTMTVGTVSGEHRQSLLPGPEPQTLPTPAEHAPSASPPPPAFQPDEYREPRYFGTQREPQRPKVVEFISNAGAQSVSAAYKVAKKRGPAPARRTTRLDTDPLEWRGRRIRKMSNRQTYTVKQVFRSGRVELERDWMTFITDVDTILDQYESAL
jgi:hypothetical protein